MKIFKVRIAASRLNDELLAVLGVLRHRTDQMLTSAYESAFVAVQRLRQG